MDGQVSEWNGKVMVHLKTVSYFISIVPNLVIYIIITTFLQSCFPCCLGCCAENFSRDEGPTWLPAYSAVIWGFSIYGTPRHLVHHWHHEFICARHTQHHSPPIHGSHLRHTTLILKVYSNSAISPAWNCHSISNSKHYQTLHGNLCFWGSIYWHLLQVTSISRPDKLGWTCLRGYHTGVYLHYENAKWGNIITRSTRPAIYCSITIGRLKSKAFCRSGNSLRFAPPSAISQRSFTSNQDKVRLYSVDGKIADQIADMDTAS